jgi:hypothetical protein
MITVTGKIEDATGAVLHARIDFTSQSTPLVGAGIVTTNTDVSIRSNPSDGTFSVQLAPGSYQVDISAEGQTTSFAIAVPNGSGFAAIDTLTTSPLLYPFVAPNTVWNRVLNGNITVSAIANPPAPTTAAVVYSGGHQTSASSFEYQIAWQDQYGNLTASSPDARNAAPTGSNNATRVLLPTPPSGVASVNIYRSNAASPNRWLLATVAANVTFYDDWQSQADFAAALGLLAPPFNTTAGGFIDSGGSQIAFLSAQGIALPGSNARYKSGAGWQLFNTTTSLWHTLLCVNNPPQLGFDAGSL